MVEWLAAYWFSLALVALTTIVVSFLVVVAVRRYRELASLRKEQVEFASLRTGDRPVPDATTLSHSIQALNLMLDRELKSVGAIDQKAALVPTAIGVAATILVGQIDPQSLAAPRAFWSGVATVAFGLLSAVAAVAVFLPRTHAIGATPYMLARYSDEDTLRMDQSIANELAWACYTVKGLNAAKAAYLVVSLTLLVATVLAAILFGISGGFGSGTT